MTRSAHDRTHLVIADDLSGVASHAADLFVRLSRSADLAGGRFAVALSGGSTPRALHALLSAPPYYDAVHWPAVELYWGDDRCVPPDDPESNYRMARETLLEALLARGAIRDEQIHRMHTELPPDQVAEAYERELRHAFTLAEGHLPRFDLLFLGMGPDGHTLSLFPHTTALTVTDRLVTANYVSKLSSNRVTLTYPVANNAAAVAFLVAGADKAEALARVLDGPRNPEEFPAQFIAPTDGDLYWLVDRAAAAQVQRGATG